jgi:hypothetical protein
MLEARRGVRRIAKTDANQPDIVSALRGVGASVCLLSQVGSGVPDLLVGFRGINLLMEVKDGNKPPSSRKLTKDQEDWHSEWRGQVVVVTTVEEAVSALSISSGQSMPPRSQATRSA